jgi:hypothetical protein
MAMHLEFVVFGPPISNQQSTQQGRANLVTWRATIAGAAALNDAMTIEERLNHLTDRYRSLGFKVVIRPGPDDLPPFAMDFKVEIVATSEKGNVLAVAKASPSELQADNEMSRYAEIPNRQPGWRMDLFVLGPDNPSVPEAREAKEPTAEEIRSSIDGAERMLRAGFTAQAVIAAWATLESTMRRRLQAEGTRAGWGTSPRTLLNELFSAGVFSNSEFRDLEGLSQLRNVIVHGFSVPDVSPSVVEFLLGVARRLLTESQPAKKSA